MNITRKPGNSLSLGRRGSLILAAAGILALVFFSYFAFMRVLSGVGSQSHALAQRNIALNFATDLGQLTGFVLQKRLSNSADSLVDMLTRPLGKMQPLKEKFDFDSGYQEVAKELLKPLQTTLKIKMLEQSFEILPGDFEPLFQSTGVQYEKSGVIRAGFLLQIGEKSQRLHFSFPVDVVFPLPGPLKRFVFYAEDASPDWDNPSPETLAHRFNILEQDQYGYLTNQKYQPLYLKPFPYTKDMFKAGFDSKFIYYNCGFIYLGGDKDLYLNLGAGFGKTGEARHLFVQDPAYSKAKNLYTHSTLSNSNYSIRVRDAGFDGSERDVYKSGAYSTDDIWLQYYAASLYKDVDTDLRSSALKLYGFEENETKPDNCFSPTLVIGQVYRRFIRQKSWRHKNISDPNLAEHKKVGIFYFPKSEADYTARFPGNDEDQEIDYNMSGLETDLNLGTGASGYQKYLDDFASRVVFQPYNHGIDYIATNGASAEPETVIANDSPYKAKTLDIKKMKYFPNDSLNPDNLIELNLEKIAGKGSAESPIAKRSSWFFHLKGALLSALLRVRGLIYGNILDLKSVVLVKEGEVLLETPGGGQDDWQLKSSGVIVAVNGDIVIKSGIKKNRDSDAIFGLVALNGKNIIIDTDHEIDALLICPSGQIIFKNKGPLKIFGGILTKKLFPKDIGKDQFENLFKQGGMIEYDKTLAQPLNEQTAKKQLIVSAALRPRLSHAEQP